MIRDTGSRGWLMAIDRNGVIDGEVRFPTSPRGLGWFASVVNG